MDNGALLNYALKRRNFLVAMWLTLQQRWFVRSFNSSARVLSWMVIALGMTLVTLTVVTIARNVVPVLTIPGSLPYYLLQLLVLIVSFNIYMNYFCATAFSRRIGKAPADYVYRDPYGADPNAVPTDDSTDSTTEEDGEEEESTNSEEMNLIDARRNGAAGVQRHSHDHPFHSPNNSTSGNQTANTAETGDASTTSAALSGDVHPLYKAQPPFQPWQIREAAVSPVEASHVSSAAAAAGGRDQVHRAEEELLRVGGRTREGGLPPLPPAAGLGAAITTTPPPATLPAESAPQKKKFGGIQIVRVFGGEDGGSAGSRGHPGSSSTHAGTEPHPRASSSSSSPGHLRAPTHAAREGGNGSRSDRDSDGDDGTEEKSSASRLSGEDIDDTGDDADNALLRRGSRRLNRSACSPLYLLGYSLLRLRRLLQRGWRCLRPSGTSRTGARPRTNCASPRLVPEACRRRCPVANCCVATIAALPLPAFGTSAAPTASPALLRELEGMAFAAERYGPRQRAYRILDTPRRYCSHCRRLKAPREHHCAICNQCVPKMDHHCPWINNCVDVENQRYFLLFITWLWAGTLLAAGFVGYGVARQQRYTRKREALYKQWLRSPSKAALAKELRELEMPYGASGVLLTSYPTIMVLAISITMFICMTLFIYVNRRLVLENTTVIESIYVDEKRRLVYRSTGFVYRNPYDLGWWYNFLDVFSPAGDPVVNAATQELRRKGSSDGSNMNSKTNGTYSGGNGDGPEAASKLVSAQLKVQSYVKAAAARVGVVLWLIGFPTFRPTHGDGVYYTTFDALASGEQTSLLRH